MKLTHRVRIASIVTGGLMLLAQFAAPVSAAAHSNHHDGGDNDDHVTICHATGSKNHPYQKNSPDKDGVVNGHLGASHQDGEDIVPPFTYKGQTYSQNWDQNGQAIWNNKCEVPNTPETPETAKLTIKKILQADNVSAQNFTFYSDELGDFQLDADNSSNTLPSEQTFDGLSAGEYGVREKSLWGWHLEELTCTGTNDFTVYEDEGRVQVNLQPGDDVTCTFLNEQMNALGGFKFNDENGNGAWDNGEPAIEGWTMTITGGEDDITASIQTNSDGFYTFTGLEDGVYTVCEEQRDGWTQTFPATDDGCYLITDFDEHNGLEKNGFDFGNMQAAAQPPQSAQPGNIKGAKFNDVNGNGAWDNGEPTLSGWTITLYDGNNSVLATAQTDQNGEYSFASLNPGDYKVCETPQATWQRTMPAGSDCYTIQLASGQTFTANFGNHPLPQVLGNGRGADVAPAATVATLVNTGDPISKNVLVGLLILAAVGAAHILTIRRKDYAK